MPKEFVTQEWTMLWLIWAFQEPQSFEQKRMLSESSKFSNAILIEFTPGILKLLGLMPKRKVLLEMGSASVLQPLLDQMSISETDHVSLLTTLLTVRTFWCFSRTTSRTRSTWSAGTIMATIGTFYSTTGSTVEDLAATRCIWHGYAIPRGCPISMHWPRSVIS